MDAFVSDFLYAFRVLFKRPGLTLLAILALAVSIGMSTTAFSILNGMFFKPLPFKDPERLQMVFIRDVRGQMNLMPVPYERLADLKGMRSFSEVMAYYSGTINISGVGRPERYDGAFVSANFLELLGHAPELGRGFTAAAGDEAAPRELLISHKLWQERFRGDPEVIGEVVRANGADHTIVGVLPDGFHFPVSSQVWMPIRPTGLPGHETAVMYTNVLARLAPGAERKDALAELAAGFAAWSADNLEQKENLVLECIQFGRLTLNTASEALILTAIVAVIFILLVSCANVANLLIGRALTRGREMAIRSAVGATRGRIVRQLLTESLVLSSFGAVGGLLYAAWSVDISMQADVFDIPYYMSFELDWRAFLFVFAVMAATALVSGLVPAWQASKVDLNEMLKDTSHTSTSFRLGRVTRVLAVIQIAFSCALLFGAGLIARNVYMMSRIEPGYEASEYLTMRMGLFPGDYPDEKDRDAFFSRLQAKAERIPGVTGAAVTSWLGQFGNYKEPFLVAAEDTAKPDLAYAYSESVSPEYFTTFGLPVLRGRGFDGGEDAAAPHVAIVNETFARALFGDADPLGQRVRPVALKGQPFEEQPQTWEIIGVVPDIRVSNFTRPGEPEPIIYLPYTQTASSFMSLVLHAPHVPKDELARSAQEIIFALDPHLPVYFTKTMDAFIADLIYPFRVLSNFFLSIGLMALFLAAIGVYGMLAFNVSRRRREIGIRMALGANTGRIVTQVLRQGFVQVALGLLVGTGLAYLVGHLARVFLIGVDPADPSVYAGVLLTLVGVATLAFFLPARRAARLSPLEALRYE